MAMRENDRLIQLVDAAFGEISRESIGEMTRGETQRLQELTALAATLNVKTWDASLDLIKRASAIMPVREVRRTFASVIGSSLGLAGARSVDSLDSFQVAYDLDGESMRVLYEREADGWHVLGRTGSADWTVETAFGLIATDVDGSFEFEAQELSDTAMTLSRDQVEIVIPSAVEVINDGSPNDH